MKKPLHLWTNCFKGPVLSLISQCPCFQNFSPQSSGQQLLESIDQAKTTIETLLSQSVDVETFILTLEKAHHRIETQASTLIHLNNVASTEDIRSTYQTIIQALTRYRSWFGQHQALYQRLSQLALECPNESRSLQQCIKNELIEFKLNGVDQPAQTRQIITDYQCQLSKLSDQFERNLMDCTDAWSLSTDASSAFDDCPASIKKTAQAHARKLGQTGYCFDLSAGTYAGVMSYCSDAKLREQFYQAYTTRASDLGPHDPKFDNQSTLYNILSTRHALAKALSYTNYAELALVKKMAESTQAVESFLLNLLKPAQKKAQKEIQALKNFAQTDCGIDQLEVWDVAFVTERYKQRFNSADEESYRPYFSLPSCLDALFDLTQRLYGTTIKKCKDSRVSVWHDSVEFYEVYDREKNILAGFYLDLFSRKKKRSGAWMANCQNRFHHDGQLFYPIVYLNCNFTPADQDKTCCLSHTELLTLFHEFGHGLHHMLTQVDYPSVAGLSGVPWDAVELPSQLMENWVWQADFLQSFAKHIDTGKPIPKTLIQSLVNSRQLFSGMAMLRQLEFALFDLRIHRDFNPELGPDQIQACLDKIRQQTSLLPIPSTNRFQNSFSHIFAGGYAGGYYSYKWAEVLSCDVFESFETEGLFNADVALKFYEAMLSKGGTVDVMDAFLTFKGRKPNVQSLLYKEGMAI